jgi:hypothetical protein
MPIHSMRATIATARLVNINISFHLDRLYGLPFVFPASRLHYIPSDLFSLSKAQNLPLHSSVASYTRYVQPGLTSVPLDNYTSRR